jgi:hypothetical protein
VGEFFYPALGTRLFQGDGKLSNGFQKQLAEYQAQRAAALTELQNKIVDVQMMAAADEERELRAFAGQQMRQLVALEDAAEALRKALIVGNLWLGNVDAIRVRQWHLGDPLPPRVPAAAEFYVLREALYFQAGLSPEQRDLLYEIVTEKRANATPLPRPPADAQPLPPVFYFSPGGARFHLPENLPGELATKIRDYERAKFEEKKILIDALTALDAASAAKRESELQALADSQAPRLARIEEFAEEVRRGLAQLPSAPAPRLPPKLPDSIAQMLAHYRADLQALVAEQERYVKTAVLQAMRERFKTWTTGRRPDPQLTNPVFVAERARAEFVQQNAARFAALRAEREQILKEGDDFARLNTDPATGQPMNIASLFAYMKKADLYFEQVGRDEAIYGDYNLAMLQPGFSPPQRRLLFHAAIARLAQPLPMGQTITEVPLPPTDFD